MADKHQPPESQIDKLVKTKTPRQLAIGYLRAQRRARQAELALDLMSDLDAATEAVRRSDGGDAVEWLRCAEERLKKGKG